MCGAKAALQTQSSASIIEFLFDDTRGTGHRGEQKQTSIPPSNTAHATSPWDEAARGVCARPISPAHVPRMWCVGRSRVRHNLSPSSCDRHNPCAITS